MIFIAVAFISAGVVATSGIIGWVGLVIPHVARALVGAGPRRLLPVSRCSARSTADGRQSGAHRRPLAEIPIGIITALIGVPVLRGDPAPAAVEGRLEQ